MNLFYFNQKEFEQLLENYSFQYYSFSLFLSIYVDILKIQKLYYCIKAILSDKGI